jgi:hypothetical protein
MNQNTNEYVPFNKGFIMLKYVEKLKDAVMFVSQAEGQLIAISTMLEFGEYPKGELARRKRDIEVGIRFLQERSGNIADLLNAYGKWGSMLSDMTDLASACGIALMDLYGKRTRESMVHRVLYLAEKIEKSEVTSEDVRMFLLEYRSFLEFLLTPDAMLLLCNFAKDILGIVRRRIPDIVRIGMTLNSLKNSFSSVRDSDD